MVWIEPLELQTWLVNVLAGDATYFVAIAIFAILSLSAYFKMNGLTMGFMVIVFLLMFSNVVPASLIVFISIIAGLIVGYIIPKIVSR